MKNVNPSSIKMLFMERMGMPILPATVSAQKVADSPSHEQIGSFKS